MKHKKTYVTEKEFERLKVLVDANLTAKQFKDITTRTHIVYGMVGQAKDFKDYQRLKAERVQKLTKPSHSYELSPTPDGALILTRIEHKIDSLIGAVNTLLISEESKHVSDKVAVWKWGKK